MAREATARVLERHRQQPTLRAIPGYGGGPPGAGRPIVGNAHLAVFMLLAAETMLFLGLVGAYIVFRHASPSWPPPGQPHLPLLVTWANTVVLLFSAYTMHGARGAARAGEHATLMRKLAITAALGVLFVGVQGWEWARLVHHGLTLSSGAYGSTFYTLIGLHAVHVVAAVLWLLGVTAWVLWGHPSASRETDGSMSMSWHTPIDVCGIYWNYVVALWVVLFVIVYLR